ncbi:molybdopterin-dependent oxidoreductase [Salininema proteolyticum]|uniref:Molybdopterin-dependent oxidoreductase n=1 Tax=Salininema proteolyticum TaxID=1607685 RepID=A0ABV8TTA5_9ACTN
MEDRRPSPVVNAVAGTAAALAGFAVSELAALAVPEGAPLTATADAVVRLSPGGLTRWAIDAFGTANKTILQVAIVVVLLAAGTLAGLAWRRRPWQGATVVAAFTAIAAAAALSQSGATALYAVPSLAGGAATVLFLAFLIRSAVKDAEAKRLGDDRRTFLFAAIAVGLASAGGALWARGEAGKRQVDAAREELDLPAPSDPAPAVEGTDFGDVPGLSSYRTPNDDFYRIDTAIRVPVIEASDWTLTVRGMVDRELTLDFEDLLSRKLIERDITLCCVSNEVGGDLVGNARWLGVPLSEILDEAGVRPGADQMVSRSKDGWTAGTPTEAVMDGRDAMLAVGMNGEPLPLEHGWPVRIVVPGLYGYVSATKWLTEIELTTFAKFDAYWIERDWGLPAPVKTSSRIDTPRRTAKSGTVAVAGVAWAQRRGIAKVEVRVDGGEWNTAELAETPSGDTWRLWKWAWNAEPGSHTLTVRATDTDGEVQTGEERGVIPDGATGWHTVTVEVD